MLCNACEIHFVEIAKMDDKIIVFLESMQEILLQLLFYKVELMNQWYKYSTRKLYYM